MESAGKLVAFALLSVDENGTILKASNIQNVSTGTIGGTTFGYIVTFATAATSANAIVVATTTDSSQGNTRFATNYSQSTTEVRIAVYRSSDGQSTNSGFDMIVFDF